ncbi:MAG: hypothetical protein KDD60_00080, partial [Bdellovibrionales bacterium]|nr:hypothetical protein [Bdellovibrionales bacterium]
MPSTYFTRTGSNQFVRSINGNSNIYFDTNYGGAPLRWNYPHPGTGVRTELIELVGGLPYPGEGFQSVTDEGQDLTQASANGLTQFQIARTGIDTGLTLYYKNYYARESTLGFPTGNAPGNLDQYVVSGFFPDFWASLGDTDGPKDDAIPPNSHNKSQTNWNSAPSAHGSGWTTGYTSPNKTSTYPFNTNTWGTPVQFSPYNDTVGDVFSGILMEGNQQKALTVPWHQRMRSIPYGRVAFRIKVSLSNASDDSFGGILFRKKALSGAGPYNMDHVYNAQGYMLNVNRNGDISLIYTNASAVQTTVFSYPATLATQNSVRNLYGIQLELRTSNAEPNKFEIWADGTPLTVDGSGNPQAITLAPANVFAAQNAEHLGLIAYTTNAQQRIANQPNFVRFGDREVFNVGTETTVTAAPQSDGSMITTIKVGPADEVTEKRKLYTATQVSFLNPAGF